MAHGQRSGLIRLTASHPQPDTPTCLRCGTKFSTWHRLQYHVQYVCCNDMQEIDQVEHRLRVQELLQFARAHQVAALRHNLAVLTYFMHHCAICGKFHSTVTGLMRHWNDQHHKSYSEHLSVLQYYEAHVDTGNPCCLCSSSFSQYHRCIIWRQLAMLLTELQMTTEFCDVTETVQLKCEHCGKAYTTRHGLAQHIQKFHKAQQVLNSSNWNSFTAKCLFDQAVQTNRCEDLISDPDILHFISSECFDCSMPFRRRQDLSRHLKQGHPSEWAEMEHRASALTASLNCAQRCLCVPPQHRVKHLCLVFLQFALARILWERDQCPAADGLPPDLAMQPQEKMEQLLWFGFAHLLYRQPALKLAMTLHCMFCGFTCRNGDAMVLHLHQHHEALVAESSIQLQLLRWVLFQDFGCACNPTRGFGVPDHTCPSLIQAAMLCVQAHWPLTIPWTFKTSDLLSHLGDLLPLNDFRRICLWMLTRQFHHLWKDPALLRVLKSHCTLCGEAVTLQYITVHLHLEHQLGPNDLHPIVVQLCRIYSVEHSEDPHCDHCGELLPTMDVLAFDPVPALHMPGCPLVLHMAAFLMHPVLHKAPYDPLAWPDPQAIEASFRRQDHQRQLFNARPSDTAGQEFDLLVSCGHRMLQDSLLLESLNHQCLMCQRTFYMPGALTSHLKQHDFKQYNTLWCLRRLQMTCGTCPCCGSDFHTAPTGCPALLNLAVLLTNGRRPRQGEFNLGISSDSWPTSQLGDSSRGRRQAIEEATTQRKGFFDSWLIGRSNSDNAEDDGSNHPQTRGLDSCAASGVRVCDVSPTGRREPTASLDGMSSEVAEGRSLPILASHNGPSNHRDGERSTGQAEGRSSQCRLGPGLHPLQSHRLPTDDALSEMGHEHTEVSAQQGEAAPDWRSEQNHRHHCQDPSVGTRNHSQISCTLRDHSRGHQQQIDPVSVDSGPSHSRGTVESLANRVISQHLATCEVDIEATDPTKDGTVQTAGTDVVDDLPKHMVRILENDTSTMCFANAAMQALTWCTLLCKGLHPDQWAYGFELLRGLSQWNPVPLNLRVFQPFVWLLFGAFTEHDLLSQQDILEFTAFILDRLAPTFISCQWCTRFQHVAQVSHPWLDSEKGDRYAPILLRFIDHMAVECSLETLIHHWHDSQGLCRASNQACPCLIVMFDRHIEGQNRKCNQKVMFTTDFISFPCFSNAEGMINFLHFRIAAVTFHIGESPHCGHHRAALKYHGNWMVYDDNRLPDIVPQLNDKILRNLTMMWLIQSNDTADRTMTGRSTSAPGPADGSARPHEDMPAVSSDATAPSAKRPRTDPEG